MKAGEAAVVTSHVKSELHYVKHLPLEYTEPHLVKPRSAGVTP